MTDPDRPDPSTPTDPQKGPSQDGPTYHAPSYHQPSYDRPADEQVDLTKPVQKPWGTVPAGDQADDQTGTPAAPGDPGAGEGAAPQAAPGSPGSWATGPTYGQAYGQAPYGQPQQPAASPYPAQGAPAGAWPGTPAYGQGYSQGFEQYPGGGQHGQQDRGTDGISITGFVLSLTCCLSVVGFVLGLVGLSRTKDGKRGGRWAAISAVVLGVIGTLVTVGAIVLGVTTLSGTQFVSEVRAGECADRAFGDTTSYPLLRDVDCDDDHDGEVLATGSQLDLDDALADLGTGDASATRDEIEEACLSLAGGRPGDALESGLASGDLEINVLGDDPGPRGSDPIICFVESSDGSKLTSSVLD